MVKRGLQYGVACVVAGVFVAYAARVQAQGDVAKPAALSSAVAATQASDASKTKQGILFSCPDLHNKDKMTLEPLSQGMDGWFFRTQSDFQEDFGLMDEVTANFTRLQHALQKRGTSLVFMSVPSRGMVAYPWIDKTDIAQNKFSQENALNSYHERLASLQKAGVIAPDIAQAIVGEHAKEASKFFFKRDHHWTSLGARSAAETTGAALKDNPLYKAQKLKKYETKEKAQGEMKHTVAMEIQRLCLGDIAAEPYPLFDTVAQTSDEEALFGGEDEGSPSILVGSSYSATEGFNFDGFLMQYTGLNIANYAISGGMLFNAMVSLTNDPAFETMKPPFLFWEAPSVYSLNDNSTAAFRQIIPALNGACKDENALAKGTFNVANGKGGIILQVPAEKKAHGSSYYLVIDTTSRALTKFTLEMEYDDDDGEWFPVDRSSRFNNAGRFFIELSDEIDSNLVHVSIDGVGNVKTTLTTRLCAVPKEAPAAPAAKVTP
jgi:alginate biosynthesis protein AlgX